MPPVVLPFVPSVGHYDFDCSIADALYTFEVRWNSRENVDKNGVPQGAWMFDIYEADETVVAQGLKINIGSYMGRYSTHSLFQNGVFAAIDVSGDYLDPTFDDLGTFAGGQRVEVRYYTEQDLVAEGFAY